ncbi:hypothetical protein DAPPUDRAFT_333204 [Daphnia pulex]|uniref:Uncharacterized protein n=1 Tax=Daphnia pulex TaxID=6669 RepID=E9HS70_DAPPU|nr:hypothetical protein DAPPUDRAFT_333204 [Daphnia pulex]|eukprot:EFX65415.1 hypothetical protein DAPPUDRAFT_333204 [Daphnia pulex]
MYGEHQIVGLLGLNHQLLVKDLIQHGFCVPTKTYEAVDMEKAMDKQPSYLRGLSSSDLSGPIRPIFLSILLHKAGQYFS